VGQTRRVLEPHLVARAASTYILSEKEGYRFNTEAPYSLDAEAFERLVDAGLEADQPNRLIVLEAARALYRGDYLPDDRDEKWTQPTRAALLERHLTVLGALAVLYLRLGRQRDAISACRDGLRHDGTRGELVRPLMLGSALIGDQEGVLRAYAEHRSALAAAGAAPEAETEELLRRLRQSPIADQPGALPAVQQTGRAGRRSLEYPPLVGRASELSLLDRALANMREGRRDLLLLEGEPGSGKSRLLEEFVARAGEQGVRALRGVCYEADRVAPYLATAELIAEAHARWPGTAEALPAPVRADLAILCPAVAPDAGASGVANLGAQGRLPRALAAYLRALAGDGGLLLCLDDMQWADSHVLQMVQRFAALSGGPPILIVGAYAGEELGRNVALAEVLRRVRQLPNVIHWPLGRLYEEHVDALVRALAGQRTDTGALSAWLYQSAAGNPFFTLTLLRDLSERGVLPLKGAHAWEVDPADLPAPDPALALPEVLRALLRERLQRVPAGARRVLECAAVAGRPTDAATLRRLAQEEEGVFHTRFDELAQRGLLRPAGPGTADVYAFSHDKVCEVAYGEMSAARRAALHTALGALLEEDDANRLRAPLLALHFEEGQEWARAVLWLDRAAQRALQLTAGKEALDFCTRALALGRAHPDETPPALLLGLTELRGRTRLQLGSELPEATDDLEEVIAALGASAPAHTFDLRLTLGLALANGSRPGAARGQLEEALLIATALGDPARRVEAIHGLGMLTWMQGDNTRAAAYYDEALALCDAHRLEGRPRGLALLGRGETHWAMGAPRVALRCYEESLALARRTGQRDLEEENLRNIAWSSTGSLGVGDYALARDLLEESLALNEGAEPWHLPLTLGAAGHVAACAGDYAGGLVRLRAACAVATERGQHNFACVTYDLLGDLYSDLRLDDLALAAYETAVAEGSAGDAGMWLPRARANVAAARLRLGAVRAREELEVALDRARAAGMTLHALRALEALAEFGVATRDVYTAAHYTGLLCDHAARAGMAELEAAALRWRSGACALQGRKAAALDNLHEALTLAAKVGRVRLQWDVHATLASLHRGEDNDLAHKHARDAQALLAQTIAGLGDASLRAGLLALHRRLDGR
jgi:DNA-binding SARP family transcriptional activator